LAQFVTSFYPINIDFLPKEAPWAFGALYLPTALPAFAIAMVIAAVVISSSLEMNWKAPLDMVIANHSGKRCVAVFGSGQIEGHKEPLNLSGKRIYVIWNKVPR